MTLVIPIIVALLRNKHQWALTLVIPGDNFCAFAQEYYMNTH